MTPLDHQLTYETLNLPILKFQKYTPSPVIYFQDYYQKNNLHQSVEPLRNLNSDGSQKNPFSTIKEAYESLSIIFQQDKNAKLNFKVFGGSSIQIYCQIESLGNATLLFETHFTESFAQKANLVSYVTRETSYLNFNIISFNNINLIFNATLPGVNSIAENMISSWYFTI